jgi:predicted PurR-regulated permease PerM
MSIFYILGNFFGRAIISYVIVWLFYLLINKLKWRVAFKKSSRWYSWLAVFLLTLSGVAASFAHRGGLA